MLNFQKTELANLHAVLQMEENDRAFICPDSRIQHEFIINSKSHRHISIFENTSRALVGYILLSLHESKKSLELDRIVIKKKGKGYGHLALKWIKQFCFEEIKYHRLWLDVFIENERAIHLYESEGFKKEGLLRECLIKEGQFRSLYIYSILINEYFKNS